MKRARKTKAAATTVLAALLAVAPAACGGGGEVESPYGDLGPREALVVVDNENTAISEMTVYLVPANGVRRRLGTVTLDARETFTVTEANWGSGFTLVGDPAGSGRIVTRRFQLARGNVIEWEVSRNRVFYAGRTGGG